MRLTDKEIMQLMYLARDSMGHGGDPLIQGRAIERAVVEKWATYFDSVEMLEAAKEIRASL